MSLGQCVSFPKSGRTWLRRMLEVAGVEKAVRFHHDGFEFNDGARPAHDFDLERRLRRYGADARIVYLDRDPRDVMVSLYHQVTGRFRDFFGFEGDISAFLRDDYFGAHTLARFRKVWAHVLAERSYLHVRYERLHQDPERELRGVLGYFGIAVGDQSVRAAVEAGRFEAMKKLEAESGHPEPWLRPRNGFPKVRRGEVGGFRDELGAADIAFLDEVFGLGGASATPA